MAKALAGKTGLFGGLCVLVLGILLVANVVDFELIVGIALIVVGALAVVNNL